jgi:hypothetical protein
MEFDVLRINVAGRGECRQKREHVDDGRCSEAMMW